MERADPREKFTFGDRLSGFQPLQRIPRQVAVERKELFFAAVFRLRDAVPKNYPRPVVQRCRIFRKEVDRAIKGRANSRSGLEEKIQTEMHSSPFFRRRCFRTEK